MLIQSIIGARNEFLRRLRNNGNLCVENTAHCDALILGSLYRTMTMKNDDYTKSLSALADFSNEHVLINQGHDRCMGAIIGLLTHFKMDIKKVLAVEFGKDEDAVVIKQEEAEEQLARPVKSSAKPTSDPLKQLPPHLKATAASFRPDQGDKIPFLKDMKTTSKPGSHPQSNIVTALDDPDRKQLVKLFHNAYPKVPLIYTIEALRAAGWVDREAADILFDAGLIPDSP